MNNRAIAVSAVTAVLLAAYFARSQAPAQSGGLASVPVSPPAEAAVLLAACCFDDCVDCVMVPDPGTCEGMGGTHYPGTGCEELKAAGICWTPVPEDINEDGNVDVNDFLLLLAAWGDCPF